MSDICPYPGLRPFNEEESIFFKGREEHIDKIISQLQEKHFVMVTGASGDGKSSLVYAGLIPRARAGFFKAKYNNWLVADFRPERAPLSSLSIALAGTMKLTDFQLIEEELSYGFSSLIEFYKSTPYYLDYGSDTYKNADEEKRAELKNKSANLLIIVDQFEEMFTNAENLSADKPSLQSLTLINLLIESSKIAEEQGLPVYIVCTMRSDYVGDCAVFKGLPEQMVYSQFFVPRLKRQEIHRAILEPAKLSGNKITNRLIERIINDLNDGQDQLPILQHALNRIWRAHRDDIAEEMDLIHYAKVGGMTSEVLADSELKEFRTWLDAKPEYKKKILANPSLNNVLSAHARDLYYQSPEFCSKYLNKTLSEKLVFRSLKKIFTCLTKYNDNRAVRNRASVEEIIQTIGDPTIDTKMIEGLINLFRQLENTLLQPFDLKGNSDLLPSTIIDITHESLIRNWTELTEWTKEENENMLVLHDFQKQLSRWNENNHSKSYLLAQGPLNYFQSWYKAFSPNASVVVKYDERSLDPVKKFNEAKLFITSSVHFLTESEKSIKAKKQLTRVITAAVILVLFAFTSWSILERNKALIQKEIAQKKTIESTKSKEEALASKELAEKAKENAISNEKIALSAKKQAELSKQQAERAKQEALTNLLSAQKNAFIAKTETEKANQALNESEKSRTVAETAKITAQKAEKKSYQLSYVSLAQNVAIKSALRADDPEVQALLAIQAFDFNKENKGEIQDHIIYEALRGAQKNFLKEESTSGLLAEKEQRELQLSPDMGSLLSADKTGAIYKWDVNGEKLIAKCLLPSSAQLEAICLPTWPNAFITAYADNTMIIWNISDYKQAKIELKLSGHIGPVRKILAHPTKINYFISAGKDSAIIIHEITNVNSANQGQKIKIGFFVKDMVLDQKTENVIVLSETGSLFWFNLSEKIIHPIEQEDKFAAKASAIALNEKNGTLFIGYTNGKIRLNKSESIYGGNVKTVYSYNELKSTIEKFSFNISGKLMAVTAADKEIRVFNLEKKELKPIGIKDQKSKTRALIFLNEDQILASFADHSLKIIETSSEKIANKFCEHLKRNLTDNEWQQNIGADVPYQKTCKSIN